MLLTGILPPHSSLLYRWHLPYISVLRSAACLWLTCSISVELLKYWYKAVSASPNHHILEVMDEGSQQLPSHIWYTCQHVSVLLLCSGKPHDPTQFCQISHSAQFKPLIEVVFINTHTHPHIHADAHPHRHTEIQSRLIFIQAIVVPFSHASQTTVKTHSNKLWLHRTMSHYRFHGDERCAFWHSLVFLSNKPICHLSKDDKSATSLPF